jgi:hypothetical protein
MARMPFNSDAEQPVRGQRLAMADHLRSLGLSVGASGDEVRAAFRRLALQYHPDLDRSPSSAQHFVEVLQAYRALQIEMGLRPNVAHYRLCPRCGQYRELLDGLDGLQGCPDCLLGITARRRLLPLLRLVTVKHVGTIALYGASILLAFAFVQRGGPLLAAASVGCAVVGLLLLFVTCMTVTDVAPASPRSRRVLDGLFLAGFISMLVLGLIATVVGVAIVTGGSDVVP